MHEIVVITAKYLIGFSILLTIAVWLKVSTTEKKRFIALAVVAAILSVLLAKVASKIYYDPRPFAAGHFTPYFAHGADNGFPSDHTLLASFLAFTAWRFSRKAGWILLALAALIGLSRVIAGVHHLADIAGSMIFALVGVWLANLLVNRIIKPRPDYQAPGREA